MIRAIAIDDEPNALRIIENHASHIVSLQLVETFTNPFKALNFLEENHIHLIFLDINMPDISGIELSRIIQKNQTFIIFTTAYSEYALESYNVNAVDYLLKPFEFPRFHAAVLKVQNRLRTSSDALPEFFFVNMGSERHKIKYQDVKYVESSGNYVTYHLQSGKVLVRSTIKQVLTSLPASGFIQVQRSYIVSLNYLDLIRDNHIYIGEVRISIGPKYREHFKSIIDSFS